MLHLTRIESSSKERIRSDKTKKTSRRAKLCMKVDVPVFDGKAVDEELRALKPAAAGSAHQFVGYGETHN